MHPSAAHPETRLTFDDFLRSPAAGRLALVAELTAEDAHVLDTPVLPGCAIALREPFRRS